MDPIEQLREVCEELGTGFETFKADHNKRIKTADDHVAELERKVNLLSVRGTLPAELQAKPTITWREAKTGRPVPVLERKQSLVALDASAATELPTIGRILRGIILGAQADDAKELTEERKSLSIAVDPSGGYTIDDQLAARWIDRLRAQTVLVEAGALTVPMGSKTLTLARVQSDPAVSWHAENAALASSDPTFGAVTLNARTAVALVRMSLELAQDSENIEQILETTLTGALAGAIDSAGLNGVTVDSGAAPTGVFNAASINKVTAIGAPANWDFVVDGIAELLFDNVPLDEVGALIAHPRLWKVMRKLKSGLTSDNTPLVAPPEVAALRKLWTTAAPLTGNTAKAMVANWSSLLFGVRKQLSVQVLREAFMGSNLQVAVLAYARCDFGVTRPTDFCALEGITV